MCEEQQQSDFGHDLLTINVMNRVFRSRNNTARVPPTSDPNVDIANDNGSNGEDVLYKVDSEILFN